LAKHFTLGTWVFGTEVFENFYCQSQASPTGVPDDLIDFGEFCVLLENDTTAEPILRNIDTPDMRRSGITP
jgi:hypothetical protein